MAVRSVPGQIGKVCLGTGILILVLAGLFLFFILQPTVIRQDSPVSRDKAISDLSFPFPSGADQICYYMLADWQIYRLYVRFEVPPEEIDSAVEYVVSGINASRGPAMPYTKRETDRTNAMLEAEFRWWNPTGIESRYYHGNSDHLAMRIWVDPGGVIHIHEFQ